MRANIQYPTLKSNDQGDCILLPNLESWTFLCAPKSPRKSTTGIVAHRRSGQSSVHGSRRSPRYAPADLRPLTSRTECNTNLGIRFSCFLSQARRIKALTYSSARRDQPSPGGTAHRDGSPYLRMSCSEVGRSLRLSRSILHFSTAVFDRSARSALECAGLTALSKSGVKPPHSKVHAKTPLRNSHASFVLMELAGANSLRRPPE
jgi:hypothetical protein